MGQLFNRQEILMFCLSVPNLKYKTYFSATNCQTSHQHHSLSLSAVQSDLNLNGVNLGLGANPSDLKQSCHFEASLDSRIKKGPNCDHTSNPSQAHSQGCHVYLEVEPG